MPSIDTIAVLGLPLSEESQAQLRAAFKTVHYRPDFTLPAELSGDVDIILGNWQAIPPEITLADLPRLKHIQMSTAGVDVCLRVCPAVQELARTKAEKGIKPEEGITISNASGIHVLSIPPWIVGNVVVLYQQLQQFLINARTKASWIREKDLFGNETYYCRSLRGRTAGMLGYGALGRETARLLKANGMNIIAANTTGKASTDPEYNIPGTGDADGSIPDKYYSTKDAAQFEEFLRNTDVLVCSLPGTAATTYLLDAAKLALLKRDAPLFLNVGRGSLIESAELLKALDMPIEQGGLFGAAIDVTDPEPLPDGHALWTHPRCIITPHISGNAENELGLGADIAIANAERLRKGERPYNLVDLARGY